MAQRDPGHTPSTWALPGPPEPPGASGQRGGRQLRPGWRGADVEVEIRQSSAHGQGRLRDPPRKAEAPCPTARSSAESHGDAARPGKAMPPAPKAVISTRRSPNLRAESPAAPQGGSPPLAEGALGWKGPGLRAPDAQLSRTPAPRGPSPPAHSTARRFRSTQTVTRPTRVSWTPSVGKADGQGAPGVGAVGQG